jgi:hypothetical protein
VAQVPPLIIVICQLANDISQLGRLGTFSPERYA